jgi:hypothetical protein
LVEQRTENPRVGGSIPSLAIPTLAWNHIVREIRTATFVSKESNHSRDKKEQLREIAAVLFLPGYSIIGASPDPFTSAIAERQSPSLTRVLLSSKGFLELRQAPPYLYS